MKQLCKSRSLFRLFKHTEDWLKLSVNRIDLSMGWTTLDSVEREFSISRRKKLRSAIDSVYNWGILSGKIKGINQSPTTGFKSNIKEEEKLPEILNIEEIRTLLKSAKMIDHEWYPIWAMAILTGMRSGELYALNWKKIDFDSKILYVYENWTNKEGITSTKGGYWRTVPLSEDLMLLLKELRLKSKGGYSEKIWKWIDEKKTNREDYMENQFVLPRFQSWKDGRQAGILRTFCKGIGVQSVKFHTLRACFATQLIKEAVAPAIIMKICGWKDLKTVQRYIRLAGLEVDGATEALKVLPATNVMENVVQLFN